MERNIFNTEHEMYRDSFRSFVKSNVVPHQEKWLNDGMVSREVWLEAGKQGYLLPWASEKYGGAGATDFQYEQIVAEELARVGESGFAIPLHSPIVAPYIAEYGSEEQKERFLPSSIKGETILAIAMTEPGTGSDLAGMRTTAVDRGDYFELNGGKTYITNGVLADVVIVAAKTHPDQSHAMGLLLVERGMEGFERSKPFQKIGMKSQDTAELFFDRVKIPKSNLLGESTKGFYYLMQELAQERLIIAITSVASAKKAFDLAVDYVKERQAFGKPISAFQNTRFKLAEMKTEIDLAQTFVDRCVEEHNQKKLTPEMAAQAKLYATELVCRITDQSLQMHGGYGYMWESPIARLYADVRIQKIYGGTSEIMKEIIGRDLLKR